MQLDGTVVIVTGAASGLGRATSELLATHGARIIGVDRDPGGLERLQESIPGAVVVEADITSPDDVANLLRHAGEVGHIGVLVNCAGGGIQPHRTVDRAGRPADLEPWRGVIELNLIAAYDLTRQIGSAMAAAEPEGHSRGVIIHVSSIAALDGSQGMSSYVASKGALTPLVHSLARDLAPLGIRVMAVAPGVFATPAFDALPESVRERRAKDYVYPERAGAPEEFARLVQHIIENDYLNGDCIRIDAGMRLHQ
ncbi:SDR family NAD(P)-dependent oxidoreductase [Nocardioides sp. AE5]|uniref:SDR family NAD(P)-dependent oxidoreductase n=1 Tax=Nocardioides sp. AE5 TaxID=2962573 RepID=UPI002880D57D|nr:SDR family NAD(P)-dependent oxidoreductase [Nocardioides sp. AE5]MDT0203188.1 SDR family NAD(P)-dependent oxidoreductase [Nocardioides sp. AE5]